MLSVYFWNLHENDTSKLNEVASSHEKGAWIHSRLFKPSFSDNIRPLEYYKGEEMNNLIEQTEGILVVRDPLDHLISAWRDKLGSESIWENKTDFLVNPLRI